MQFEIDKLKKFKKIISEIISIANYLNLLSGEVKQCNYLLKYYQELK